MEMKVWYVLYLATSAPGHFKGTSNLTKKLALNVKKSLNSKLYQTSEHNIE